MNYGQTNISHKLQKDRAQQFYGTRSVSDIGFGYFNPI